MLAEDATGLDASQSVRKKLPIPDIAVITLTGWYQGMRGIPHIADMALAKPFNPQELKQFAHHLRTVRYPQEMTESIPKVATVDVVVCDEPRTAQYIGKTLESAGYLTHFAWSKSQVFSMVATHHPWLIVVAEAMLSPDERQAMDRLFAQGTKVIFLDAHPEEPGGGLRAFPRDSPITINKPFNPQELVQVARRLRTWWEQEQTFINV